MHYNGVGDYHGFWENNRRHGEGVFTYKNGDVYSGWWRHGNKEGYGTYEFADTKMKMIGQWKDAKLTEGRWIYPNGLYWLGKFENNKPCGQGTWYFKNGNQLEGTFEQKPKEKDENAEESEVEGEPGAKKEPKFDLVWHTTTNIASSAHQVNSVEQ